MSFIEILVIGREGVLGLFGVLTCLFCMIKMLVLCLSTGDRQWPVNMISQEQLEGVFSSSVVQNIHLGSRMNRLDFASQRSRVPVASLKHVCGLECNISGTPWGKFFKFGTNVLLWSRMNGYLLGVKGHGYLMTCECAISTTPIGKFITFCSNIHCDSRMSQNPFFALWMCHLKNTLRESFLNLEQKFT